MRETQFFFDETEYGRDTSRALPCYGQSFLAPHASLRADAVFSYTEEEAEEVALLSERILDELATHGRTATGNHIVPSAPLFDTLAAYGAEHPEMILPPLPDPDVPLSVHSPNLFFCFGTVMHHALATRLALRITAEEDFHHLRISLHTPHPARTEADVAAQLGLNAKRLAVLQRIADASDFSLSLTTGEDSAITFAVHIAVSSHLRLCAWDEQEADLLAVLLLPRKYFVF